MYPYLLEKLKSKKKRGLKNTGLATDCLFVEEPKSVEKFFKGNVTESVKLVDKVIGKVPKFKRGGIYGTEYNQNAFILPMLTPEYDAEQAAKKKKLTLEDLLQGLLKEGYHMVFEELHNMIQQNLEERKNYETNFGALKTKPLNEELETIQFITHVLKAAENAKNKGNYKKLLNSYLDLAIKFSENKNSIADQFYERSFFIALNYPCDKDGYSLAKTKLHTGLYDMANKNYPGAYEKLHEAHSYAKKVLSNPNSLSSSLTTNSNQSSESEEESESMRIQRYNDLLHDATINLVTVCFKLAEMRLANQKTNESEAFYHEALLLAEENMKKKKKLILEQKEKEEKERIENENLEKIKKNFDSVSKKKFETTINKEDKEKKHEEEEEEEVKKKRKKSTLVKIKETSVIIEDWENKNEIDDKDQNGDEEENKKTKKELELGVESNEKLDKKTQEELEEKIEEEEMEEGSFDSFLQENVDSIDEEEEEEVEDEPIIDPDILLYIDSLRKMGAFYASIRRFNEALNYFMRCLELCEKEDDRRGIAAVSQAVGGVYFMLDDLDQAKKYYSKFVEVSDKGKDKKLLVESYIKTGAAFNNAGHYGVAHVYAQNAFDEIIKNPDFSIYEDSCRALLATIVAHKKLGMIEKLLSVNNNLNKEKLLYFKSLRFDAFSANQKGEFANRGEILLRETMEDCELRRDNMEMVVFLSLINQISLSGGLLSNEVLQDQLDFKEEDEEEEEDELFLHEEVEEEEEESESDEEEEEEIWGEKDEEVERKEEGKTGEMEEEKIDKKVIFVEEKETNKNDEQNL